MSPDCCTLINVSFTAQVPLRFYFRCQSLHSTVLRSLLHYVCLTIPIYLHFLSMLLHAKTMAKCLLQVYTAVKRLPISFTQGIKNLAKSYSNGKRIDFFVCVSLCEKSSPFFKWRYFLSSAEYFQAIWQTLLICRLVVLTIFSSSSLVNH